MDQQLPASGEVNMLVLSMESGCFEQSDTTSVFGETKRVVLFKTLQLPLNLAERGLENCNTSAKQTASMINAA